MWSKWNLYSKNLNYNYNIYIAKEIPGVSRNELFPRSSSHPTLPDINLISKLRLTSDTEKADYILVTESGCKILSNALPRHPDEVEAYMAKILS